MKSRCVADIMGPWVDPDFESSLVERCKRYWSVPVDELPNEMLATYLRQRIATQLMIPEARKRIDAGIHDDSEHYDGELAHALEGACCTLSRPPTGRITIAGEICRPVSKECGKHDIADPYWKLRPPPPTPDDEICTCPSATPVLLVSTLSPNPLSCARCNLEVPPERIGFDASLADALASWRDFHDCFFLLWLDSGEFEEWAKSQLLDPSSVVNTRGLGLAAKVNTVRRCYLYWFQDETDPHWVEPRECPLCSAELEARFEGERPEGGTLYVCEHCSIALAG